MLVLNGGRLRLPMLANRCLRCLRLPGSLCACVDMDICYLYVIWCVQASCECCLLSQILVKLAHVYRMKYRLCVTDHVLDRYGDDPALGYDIMCAFMKTLCKSSFAKKVKDKRLIGVVPAFHGHAHNRKCQVHWHPMYTEEVGTEDFVECERTFFASNDLAPVTRLATPFHRRQEIQEHFKFHDMDKEIGIGAF
jgi:hypothetical protein